MSSDAAITVSHLGKCYEIYRSPRDRLKQAVIPSLARLMGIETKSYFREFWALKDVSFAVQPGETFGIIGKNGSGKSTLLQILAGILSPTEGQVSVKGRVAALLELGSGFNPDFTGRENVFLNGQILGLTEKEIAARYDEIAEFADIGEFIDQPVKTYSSGMFLRLAFAVQAHIDASIVIVDEALAVGDVFFRQKCYARMEKLKASGAAVLLVSHSMPDIEQYCDRALVLDAGRIEFLGPAVEASKIYYFLERQENSLPTSGALLPSSTVISSGSFVGSVTGGVAPSRQITNGKARCAVVNLTDRYGVPCGTFQQGDEAIFSYAFECQAADDVPICGLVIRNERGTIVYGKNSWQFDDLDAHAMPSHGQVVCRHLVKLNLAPGDYVYEVGIASIHLDAWRRRSEISHEEMSALYKSLCQVPEAGSFSIGLKKIGGIPILTHHGVADLPANLRMHIHQMSESAMHE